MKSQKQLESFTAYCKAYPNERFWQALRNWSKYHFIIGRTLTTNKGETEFEDEDTFYIE